ncbi:MAG TPA: tail fiber protein [Iamia sp.]|jgi:microcystin-dependent protein|nr:tail fiber protein [Iamia sp.]
MSQQYLGEIRLFPYNFAPRSWAFCNGQLMSIAQSTALFSLLGTTYGGNGQTTFGLPDLRGRSALSSGQGPGLQPYDLGEVSGVETVTLIQTEMPAHGHSVLASTSDSSAKNPSQNILGSTASPIYAAVATANAILAPQTIGIAGGSQPHENRSPFLVLNYCIALEGIFPSRN